MMLDGIERQHDGPTVRQERCSARRPSKEMRAQACQGGQKDIMASAALPKGQQHVELWDQMFFRGGTPNIKVC